MVADVEVDVLQDGPVLAVLLRDMAQRNGGHRLLPDSGARRCIE
jgi:hypothetical protein